MRERDFYKIYLVGNSDIFNGLFFTTKSISHEMENICANFLWKKCHGKRGIHWCEWKKLCKLKENRGLDFYSLAKFNLSLLAKQGWRLINYPNLLLAHSLKAKY